MSSAIITQKDLELTYQHVLNIRVRVLVYDNDMNYVDTINCTVVSGTFNMDANSDVRRTASFVLSPLQPNVNILIEEDSLIWLNRNIVLEVGIQEHRTQEYTYYKLGTFLIMTYSSTYDATTNQLTINCSDWMARLDGTKNGELSSLVTSFPAYREYLYVEEPDPLGIIIHYFDDEHISYEDSVYHGTLDDEAIYRDGDYIVFKVPVNNNANASFEMNSLGVKPIYDSSTGFPIAADVLYTDYIYSFKIKKGEDGEFGIWLTSHVPMDSVKDGVPIEYFDIRQSMITAITRLGGLEDYQIDDIGEYYAMSQYNDDWEAYRVENPLWNNVPYDLEFNAGDNVLSVVTSLRDLYPNYETYFNADGIFCCNMIPSAVSDDIFIYNDYLHEILISENFDIDTTSVRNICEVWGQALETDFTANTCTLEGNVYTIDIDEYGDTIYAGDRIAVQVEDTNPAGAQIVIHTKYTEADGNKTVTKEVTFPALDIYDEMTDMPLEGDILEAGAMYVFKIRTVLVDGKTPTKYIYLQSEFQPQAIDVLTDGSVSEEMWTCADGTEVNVWSKAYFADKYGCKVKNIHFTKSANSAFTIQKLGEVLSVKQGGEYDNITSDQRALARAEYENWKMARLVDAVSITVKLCLFLDVNKKIEYKRHDQDEVGQFLITGIAHDFTAGTTTITMTRFWPLYMDGFYSGDGNDYDGMKAYTHNALSAFSHNTLRGK